MAYPLRTRSVGGLVTLALAVTAWSAAAQAPVLAEHLGNLEGLWRFHTDP